MGFLVSFCVFSVVKTSFILKCFSAIQQYWMFFLVLWATLENHFRAILSQLTSLKLTSGHFDIRPLFLKASILWDIKTYSYPTIVYKWRERDLRCFHVNSGWVQQMWLHCPDVTFGWGHVRVWGGEARHPPNVPVATSFISKLMMGAGWRGEEELLLPCKQTPTARFCRINGREGLRLTVFSSPSITLTRPLDSAQMYLLESDFPKISVKAFYHVRSITERSRSQSLIMGLLVWTDALMAARVLNWACKSVIR